MNYRSCFLVIVTLLVLCGLTLDANAQSDPSDFDRVVNFPNGSELGPGDGGSIGSSNERTQFNFGAGSHVGDDVTTTGLNDEINIYNATNIRSEILVTGNNVLNLLGGSLEVNVGSGGIANVYAGFPYLTTIESGGTMNLTGGTVGLGPRVESGGVFNMHGGFAGSLRAESGSTVNISAGRFDIGLISSPGSSVTITGGNFRLNGQDHTGPSINLSPQDVFTGTTRDGRAFILSPAEFDRVIESVSLNRIDVPASNTRTYNYSGNNGFPLPATLNPGETLNFLGGSYAGSLTGVGATVNFEGTEAMRFGGTQPYFRFSESQLNLREGTSPHSMTLMGSVLNVTGGQLGDVTVIRESIVNVNGGTLGGTGRCCDDIVIKDGSTMNVSGGVIDFSIDVDSDAADDGYRIEIGSAGVLNVSGGHFGGEGGHGRFRLGGIEIGEGGSVNVSGGSFDFNAVVEPDGGFFGGPLIGNRLIASEGSQLTLAGTEFFLNGELLDDLNAEQSFVITDRDIILSGTLLDGSPFSFDLSNRAFDISESAVLAVKLIAVPEPSTAMLALLSTIGLFFVMSRSKRHKAVSCCVITLELETLATSSRNQQKNDCNTTYFLPYENSLKKSNTMKTTLLTFGTTLLFILTAAYPSAFAQTLQTVVLSGDAAPGTGAGVNFSGFAGAPSLNGAGQTAFFGSLTGTGVNGSNDSGIFLQGGGSGLALIARTGDAAPGTGDGGNFLSFGIGIGSSPVLNGAGRTAFRASFTGTGVNNNGIFSQGGGSGLALVARDGDAAPGTGADVNFSNFSSDLALNGAGQTAFLGFLTGTGVGASNDLGIFSEGGGSGLALVAREGDAAPGAGAGVNFGSFFGSLILNGAGQTAFFKFLTGTGVDTSNNHGIFSQGGGSGLALVARSGDAAPGTGAGVNFGSLAGPPSINGAGQTAFRAFLTGTGVDGSNNSGIFSKGGGSGLALVARSGDAAPGTGAGVNFSGFGGPLLNGAGQMAFFAFLTGTGVDGSNNSSIFSQGGGSGLALVAREGDPAPGTGAGVNFAGGFNSHVLNGAGQTAFFGGLTGTGVDDSNDRGIWATGLDGLLTLIARTGDLLDVEEGIGTDLRTISSLDFFGDSGNEDGRRSGFNDLGQLVFSAGFTDGTSGVFISNLVTQPSASGDFNSDGIVDAADYTVWLDNLGNLAGLPNDNNLGTVGQSHYDLWKANFGLSAGSGAIDGENVPEPSTILLGSLFAAAIALRRRRQTRE